MNQPPTDEENAKKGRIWEDIFIILCIPTLWPVVMGWNDPVYRYPLYAALAGLVVIFFRRMQRFREARDQLRDDPS